MARRITCCPAASHKSEMQTASSSVVLLAYGSATRRRGTDATTSGTAPTTAWSALLSIEVLAGHKALSTTQRYIEADAAAQKKVVDLV